ncbi:hypothetical protein AJ80_03640 [Polytolypa hystricis UAMH7299]|uniref:Uncharacterized protein n=1 Tax=Polytolypa hystricis (strain UAMH7299) TaxID=1447883 RepID=A0A2B7YHN0_POLH7|nr:hypothetical protein AJ80_03640 [Polytolypa hystricis UAMH7299]
MEASPLNLAHAHARNALNETRKSNPVAASEEHDLAAGEFATAAQGGNLDPDALRTLQLLEQHHKRLAEILRFQHEHPALAAQNKSTSNDIPTGPHRTTTEPSKSSPSTAISSSEATQQPPRLNRPFQRDNTSFITSNLASARGIPSHPRRGNPVSPTLSAQYAGAKMADSPMRARYPDTGHREIHAADAKRRSSQASGSNQFWAPRGISPTDIAEQQMAYQEPHEPSRRGYSPFGTEEPFQQFYSTFAGLISKISPALAFASLPLGTDSSRKSELAQQKSAAETKVDRRAAAAGITSHSSNHPDVSKLISSAALRAIKDRNGVSGPTSPGNPAESFYVVPTSGGTISYAGILSRAEKDAVARRNSFDDNDDDFVDARESPSSPESTMQPRKLEKHGKDGGRSSKSAVSAQAARTSTKTMEELQMENQALKHLSDTLSKRLHMWEVNAQSSSLALQQSLKAIHHHSSNSPRRPLSPTATTTTTTTTENPPSSSAAATATAAVVADAESKIRDLEDLLRRGEKELENVEQENKKLRVVVGRYRDRWEKLKEGARVRREGNGSGSGTGGGGNSRPTTTAISPIPEYKGDTTPEGEEGDMAEQV